MLNGLKNYTIWKWSGKRSISNLFQHEKHYLAEKGRRKELV